MPKRAAPAAADGGLDPAALFSGLGNARGLILAVSGGPDSTALMLLVSRWASRPPCLVVSVDHGLRAEAASEAAQVARNAERLGLPCRIMRAEPWPGRGNLQNWARRARYACLTKAVLDAGFDTIVTAHHRDDQAETFLLRLARGSGVYGLAAIPPKGERDAIRIVRALLDVRRDDLAALAVASGLPVAHDSSNTDRRFARARMRALMPALAAEGLSTERLAGTATALARAAAALDHYATALLREHFAADALGTVRGRIDALLGAPEEIALRALARIVRAAGGAEFVPELAQIEALRAAITAAPENRWKRTLHGAVVALQNGELVALREWGRAGLPTSAIVEPALVWDRRFRIAVSSASPESRIGPLGATRRRLRLDGGSQTMLRLLPGLFTGGELRAAPDVVSAVDNGPPLARLAVECLVGKALGLAAPSVQSP